MLELSDTAKSLLALLNNINELIVLSSDRMNASEVIRAMASYAKNKNFDLPKDKIDNFLAVLFDARPITLTNIVKDIAEDVVMIDKKRSKNKVV